MACLVRVLQTVDLPGMEQSGSVQLALSGFIALICFFIGGVVIARILYRGGDAR